MKIIEENKILNGYFKVYKALIEQNIKGVCKRFFRLKLKRPNAVAILLYNKQNDSIVLVKQYRYPVLYEINKKTTESIAGIIDEGETPSEAIIRETLEETGYKINKKNLFALSINFMSPGYSSEKIYNYAAIVTNKDKITNGGGVKGENEDIEVIEKKYLEFRSMVENGSIVDAKTKILYYEASNAGIFNQKKIITYNNNKKSSKVKDNNQLNMF